MYVSQLPSDAACRHLTLAVAAAAMAAAMAAAPTAEPSVTLNDSTYTQVATAYPLLNGHLLSPGPSIPLLSPSSSNECDGPRVSSPTMAASSAASMGGARL